MEFINIYICNINNFLNEGTNTWISKNWKQISAQFAEEIGVQPSVSPIYFPEGTIQALISYENAWKISISFNWLAVIWQWINV